MSATLKAALVGGIARAVMAVGTAALAGTGIGGVFNLGAENAVDAQTLLKGTINNSQLRVTNQLGTDSAMGVYGIHSAAAGAGPPIRGDTSSTGANAAGVLGRVGAAGSVGSSAGVRGVNAGPGNGVSGQSSNG